MVAGEASKSERVALVTAWIVLALSTVVATVDGAWNAWTRHWVHADVAAFSAVILFWGFQRTTRMVNRIYEREDEQ